jgi:fructosamine-3-kinase
MNKLSNIIDDTGLNVLRYEQVHGGDINETFCLFTDSDKYFLKINDANKYPGMFQKEGNGLDLLRRNSSLIVPRVIRSGIVHPQQYLLLEWIEKGSVQTTTWENFGTDLAKMHKQPQTYFGLHEDNYIGSLQQINKRYNDWDIFYAECRIMPLIKLLFHNGYLNNRDVDSADLFCKRLTELFPVESPSLLHGDLWGGNFMITSSGKAAIYDPAVYYGHREMDIAMSKLFGGFDSHFYAAYNNFYPMEKGWEKRLRICQLYPLLVHAVLFGGHYVDQAKEIFKYFN